jgi:hypothetical protein
MRGFCYAGSIGFGGQKVFVLWAENQVEDKKRFDEKKILLSQLFGKILFGEKRANF